MTTSDDPHPYVSRAGDKLAHALNEFRIDTTGMVCADLGCSTGGFTECLLRTGAKKVFAVDRGYGVLHYKIRNDPRVVVLERTDARSVHLPEQVNLITIDCGWTRQSLVLPSANRLLAEHGRIISLIKPQYEAEPAMLKGGILPDDLVDCVLATVRSVLPSLGLQLLTETTSPIRGQGGNMEVLWLLIPA
ncbi:MAG: SAM-dependent methyltransferase [Planctomycetota bacterium]